MADFNSEFFIDYSSLDDFQRQLIDRKNNKSMVVSGSAGSGKSLIALHKAKQIAALGESYTIIVYTKSLRKYFRMTSREDPFPPNAFAIKFRFSSSVSLPYTTSMKFIKWCTISFSKYVTSVIGMILSRHGW